MRDVACRHGLEAAAASLLQRSLRERHGDGALNELATMPVHDHDGDVLAVDRAALDNDVDAARVRSVLLAHRLVAGAGVGHGLLQPLGLGVDLQVFAILELDVTQGELVGLSQDALEPVVACVFLDRTLRSKASRNHFSVPFLKRVSLYIIHYL